MTGYYDEDLQEWIPRPPGEDEYFADADEGIESLGLPEIILALDSLDPKTRFVVELRFGLRDGESHTQEEVAALLGMRLSSAQYIENRGLFMIRQILGLPR